MMKLYSSKIVLLFTSLMILLMIGVAVISLTYIPLKVKESQGYNFKEDKSFETKKL